MEVFGKLANGEPVHRVRIEGGGLTAWVLDYGALLQDLRLEGHAPPLVLGFSSFAPYPTLSPYFGAIVGRCANRVRRGHLDLDGVTYQLDCNEGGKHTLHGGVCGFGSRLWQIENLQENAVTLSLVSNDGDMGFPGRLVAFVTYTLLPGGILDVTMRASGDAPTLCNLAHHSYFNLDGADSIKDHLLQIDASHYLPVYEDLIPTGEQSAVAGTRFDFTTPRAVGGAFPLDHNYCLSEQAQPLRPVAWLHSTRSAVRMECRTTEPGLQVYDGGGIDIALPGLTGSPMGPHAGLALEPQKWPDANHNPGFQQAVLRPGETYRQQSQYVFAKTHG